MLGSAQVSHVVAAWLAAAAVLVMLNAAASVRDLETAGALNLTGFIGAPEDER